MQQNVESNFKIVKKRTLNESLVIEFCLKFNKKMIAITGMQN